MPARAGSLLAMAIAAALLGAAPAAARPDNPTPYDKTFGVEWDAPEAPASPHCSEHFCVHWVEVSKDAPTLVDLNHDGTPDFVEAVDDDAEVAYSVENGAMGWPAPVSDVARGGDARTDVYIVNLKGFN